MEGDVRTSTSVKRPPIGGDIELEVDRPHPVGRIGDRGRRGGTAAAVASSPLRYAQSFFTPKRLFVIQSALTSECRAPLCSSERHR